jgi:hypothetical protein
VTVTVRNENEYEDLLAQWADLELGLGVILGSPGSTQEFANRVVQYDRWMQGLLQRDPDVGLYLLFQLASNSPVGYSASHSLVCATLCHLIASELGISTSERDSVVRAALTMNIAMTALQDQLARQIGKPTRVQQDIIDHHPAQGSTLLTSLGVDDAQWIATVAGHHDDASSKRLVNILKVVDRYAAMISPRVSREGRSASESARTVIHNDSDEIGATLVRVVGMYPPGTYVRMDNDELAVVLRRSDAHNQPHVAIIGNAVGAIMPTPRLHRSSDAAPHIRSALAASAVRQHVNHHHVLQLGAHVAKNP